MPPRLFTLEQAESLLPRLKPLLEDMRQLKAEHDRLELQLARLSERMKSNGNLLDIEMKQVRTGMEEAAGAINDIIRQIHETGCEVKDIDMGMVDFRSQVNGREAYLCWKLDEERIEWWHDLHTGFAGRRPLEGDMND